VNAALHRFPIELIEMEEAFGLPCPIVRMGRVPVVTRLHGPWFVNGDVLGVAKDAAFHRRLRQERHAIVCSDAVSAPSQDILERTRAFYDLPLEGARVIPYPVADRNGEAPWKLADCDRNRIVFVGRFDRHKGADVLFEAFSRLAASRPALQLDFVGPDRTIPDEAGRPVAIGPWLERHVADPSIRSRIMVHGQKSAAAASACRLRGAVTVVASRYETFGYTAVEAMSQGCPLVATNAGGLAEIVRDGQTGLSFRAGDSASLVAQIVRLLDAPEFAARLGEAARADVRRRYDPASIAREMLEFYASVVDRWRSNGHRHVAHSPRR
jgi:glycosyltransferase involved in cell wall biosynthesis